VNLQLPDLGAVQAEDLSEFIVAGPDAAIMPEIYVSFLTTSADRLARLCVPGAGFFGARGGWLPFLVLCACCQLYWSPFRPDELLKPSGLLARLCSAARRLIPPRVFDCAILLK